VGGTEQGSMQIIAEGVPQTLSASMEAYHIIV
jgi:hypothetical protein